MRKKKSIENTGAVASEDPPLRLEWIDPAGLNANPLNWRTHPGEQVTALADVISQVGWAGALLFNERTKRLIDGHARKELFAGKGKVPVLVGAWSEEQEKLILATLDPLAAMAESDDEKLRSLLAQVEVENEPIKNMLAELAKESGLVEPAPKEKEDEADFRQEFSVLIRCQNEPEQQEVIRELDRHGLNIKALVVDYPVLESEIKGEAPKVAAKGREIVRSIEVERTPRVIQLEGLFDVPPAKRAEEKWRCDVTLDRPWQLGLIVGPSGSGKSTVAQELFGESLVGEWAWDGKKAVVDCFPEGMPIAEITGLLSSVGFSSPPSWVKPYHVLSNGEKFRVSLARTLAEKPGLAVIDEFTSVVDRTVAQVGSAAVAKLIRGSGRRLVAVSCHYDIEEWLQPDWKLEMPAGALVWRSLRRRPEISLRVRRASCKDWPTFGRHHYLSHALSNSAKCFIGEVEGRPACFTAVLHNPHAVRGWWREHRTVCLPDFQGVGIGNAMSELIAGAFTATGKAYRSTTSHPAMIRHRLRSPKWVCIRRPSFAPARVGKNGKAHQSNKSRAAYRYTASFEWIGPERKEAAEALGVLAEG